MKKILILAVMIFTFSVLNSNNLTHHEVAHCFAKVGVPIHKFHPTLAHLPKSLTLPEAEAFGRNHEIFKHPEHGHKREHFLKCIKHKAEKGHHDHKDHPHHHPLVK